MQNKTITLGDLRDFVQDVQIYLTENPNIEEFESFKQETKRLSESLLREIPISPKQIVLLSNKYPIPPQSLEIFLEIRRQFEKMILGAIFIRIALF